jgi:hypothetical protein
MNRKLSPRRAAQFAAVALAMVLLPGVALAAPETVPASPDRSATSVAPEGQGTADPDTADEPTTRPSRTGDARADEPATTSGDRTGAAEKCPGDALCLWPSAEFTGSITQIDDAAVGCHRLPRAARSAMNDSAFDAAFFDGADCDGTVLTRLKSGDRAPDLPSAASVRLSPKPARSPRSAHTAPSATGGGQAPASDGQPAPSRAAE